MNDTIQKIADEIDGKSGNANGITPALLMGWAERLRAISAAPAGVSESLKVAFPLLDDAGLDEVEHCCEWTLQHDRKRLHAWLAGLARDYDDGDGDE